MKRLPPLNPLRAFEAIARHGTMTRAAHELHVTHSAISHQIGTLEAALGVQLFDRSGHRLKLTAQGTELLPAVSAAFESLSAATARMTQPVAAGTLSIACMPALLSFWLMPRLGAFTARFPETRLTFTPAHDPATIRASNADVLILYGDGDWTGMWFKRLSHFALFPVLSPTLMNSQPIRTLRDLGRHAILHADTGREWRQWLAAADGLDLALGAQHHLSDARLALEAAVHGHGVAMGDTITTAELLATGHLIAPFNLSVPAADGFYVASPNDLRPLPVVSAFIDWLTAEFDKDGAQAIPQSSGWNVKRASSRSKSRSSSSG